MVSVEYWSDLEYDIRNRDNFLHLLNKRYRYSTLTMEENTFLFVFIQANAFVLYIVLQYTSRKMELEIVVENDLCIYVH